MSHEEYVERLSIANPNLEVIGTYIDSKTKILHRCKTHNCIFEKFPCSALRGSGCKECANDQIKAKRTKTQEQYIAEVEEINPHIEVIGTYKGVNDKILHKCKIHNIIWEASPLQILHNSGCENCAKENYHKSTAKTHEQYVDELKNIHDNIEVLEEYKGANKRLLHKCIIHNYEWYATPANLLYGKGCPKCSNTYRRTNDDYIKELKENNPNIIALEKYINANIPIKHKCLIHNYEWFTTPSRALKGVGCKECQRIKLSKGNLKTNEEFLAELKNIHPNIIPLEEYVGASTIMKFKCNIDGYEWSTSPSSVLNHNCPKCSKRAKPTVEELNYKVKELNPYITVIGEYVNAHTPIKVKCDVDNFEWEMIPDVLLRGVKCPICGTKSLGEINIIHYLNEHNIEYKYQKTFKDCKYIKPLHFDFYLPKYNMCIEYDGIQHYKPIDFANKGEDWAEEMFNKNLMKDTIKDQYCKDNGITLVRIPYFKNVEEELNLLFA